MYTYQLSTLIQSFNDYLATLGELEGFIDSQSFDRLAGDFNVDFQRDTQNKLLLSFMGDYILSAVDLTFDRSVLSTYQHDDDSSITSWIDHILCDSFSTACISGVKRRNLGFNLSDHFPLTFIVDFNHTAATSSVLSPQSLSVPGSGPLPLI